eukprot:Cvel_23510.t1-p1 / transcript=Cvel_23510.t1 / gene=Cvel_23510 / organism=Chromera_velia_CCMP2878 / gene_product=hypothetical protein / transcript_product=hypothetical protein / location=Cvel_scaffold2431:656-1696(-) / protein_length=347 / sequence_SO=supercontig / SO=protein_coding / is_pseudo=false
MNTADDQIHDGEWVMSEEGEQKCRWAFDGPDGPEGVAFRGPPLNQYVCPSMFRDLSDWVFTFPFNHFGEKVEVPPLSEIVDCLRPGAIIYSQTGPHLDQFASDVAPLLKHKFILVTGQSDYWATQWGRSILDSPNLIKWFAQNPDIVHPKLEVIPIGINCFEHAPELHAFRSGLGAEPRAGPKAVPHMLSPASNPQAPIAVANFNPKTHPSRQELLDSVCDKGWVHCKGKTVQNRTKGNPHLTALYESLSEYPLWLSPRGNGLDCHRQWEAIYAGRIPVMEHSLLDPLFEREDFPVILVESLLDVDETVLRKKTDDLVAREWPRVTLFRPYWRRLLEITRRKALGLN